ncbi:MAG: hypothetical protein IT500_15325 [Rubrivivax sp.]|nr:hypothetical protein [Rubrivivax sp.]
MSRGKKLTKAQKRIRRARRSVVEQQQSEDDRRVAAKVEVLSCEHAAADELAVLCGSAAEHTSYDVDTVVAAELLWRRAAPDHSLSGELGQLLLELKRHHDSMLAFMQRFDAMMTTTVDHDHHRHLEPSADDLERIRFAVLGDDDPDAPLASALQPPA